MKRLLTITGYTVDQTLQNTESKNKAINAITQGFKSQQLQAVIAEQHTLAHYQEAFDSLISNKHIGKIIITP